MPGTMRSRNSTTVTSEPSRRHTEPSSSPITPAPTTRSFSGTLPSTSAPVDDTMRFSSMSMPLSRATSEPVAMTMFFVSSVCVLPPSPVTSTLPGAGDAAGAAHGVDLVLLEQEIDALDVAVDAFVLEFHHRGEIELGLADPDAHLREAWPASSNSSEACSSAFDGMQPTFRQVPPKVLSFSTTAVFKPSCAARMAQT